MVEAPSRAMLVSAMATSPLASMVPEVVRPMEPQSKAVTPVELDATIVFAVSSKFRVRSSWDPTEIDLKVIAPSPSSVSVTPAVPIARGALTSNRLLVVSYLNVLSPSGSSKVRVVPELPVKQAPVEQSPTSVISPEPLEALMVMESVVSSVVIVILVPATKVVVSLFESATTVF